MTSKRSSSFSDSEISCLLTEYYIRKDYFILLLVLHGYILLIKY